jgi:hypothetical protein
LLDLACHSETSDPQRASFLILPPPKTTTAVLKRCAARYFAAEVDGIDRKGTNQRGTARVHPVLQRCTGRCGIISKDEQVIDLST